MVRNPPSRWCQSFTLRKSDIRERVVDRLVQYSFFDETRIGFLRGISLSSSPVVERQSFELHRELTLSDGDVTVSIGVGQIEEDAILLAEELMTRDGELASSAFTTLRFRHPDVRASGQFTVEEIARLMQYKAGRTS